MFHDGERRLCRRGGREGPSRQILRVKPLRYPNARVVEYMVRSGACGPRRPPEKGTQKTVTDMMKERRSSQVNNCPELENEKASSDSGLV